MHSDKHKHILVAVLDWGLGHATRCVPVIRMLLLNHCKVSVAGNGESLALLKQEFPQLTFHELPSYRITYPLNGFLFLHLLLQSPRVFRAIRYEHRLMQRLIEEHKFDAIISDNRYGCYSKHVQSVIITHQLTIQVPSSLSWSRAVVNRVNHRMIKRFSACWVPDIESSQLSGNLSKATLLKVRYVGLLSRFLNTEVEIEHGLIVALVSGPEPQREIFEKLLLGELKKLNQRSMLVRGLPSRPSEVKEEGKITIINHASADDLQKLIAKADVIISRSGYSTIMDLYTLGKRRIVFIPTPGQIEQEYLADKLDRDHIAFTQTQDRMNIQEAIDKSKMYHGFDTNEHRANLLDEAVQELLQRINFHL
jgi:uncharacterized protein (TIGR00661 family)